jgi:hypothetical protein
MTERGILICIHAGLFALQLLFASLAIVVDPKFATLAAPTGVAQAFFPNPFRSAP